MFKPSRILALGGFLMIAACGDPMGLAFGSGCLMDCGWGSGGAGAGGGYWLSPLNENILRGDTITYYTYDCVQLFCETNGNVNSRWSIEGDAAGIGAGAGVFTRTLGAGPRIVVHGLAVGPATIRAVALADSTQSRTATVFVGDSSAITELRVRSYSGSGTLGVRGQLYVVAELVDANGRVYRTQPADWSISDTSVARLTPTRYPWSWNAVHMVEAKTTGTTEVTTTFMNLSAKLLITVLP